MAKFVRAYESADLDALVALLTDDVFMSMPPMPFEYEGRDVVARFCASIFGAGRRFDLVPTRANGQPAFGAYLRAPTGIRHGTGLLRPHPHRRPDLRHDPLRQQRAPVVRAAAIAPEPIASFRRDSPLAQSGTGLRDGSLCGPVTGATALVADGPGLLAWT